MTNLKEQLIRLGSENPQLQEDIRLVLDDLTGSGKQGSELAHFKVYGMGEFSGDDWEIEDKLERAGFTPDRAYSSGNDLVVEFSGPGAYDEAVDAVGRMAREYQVSKAFRGGY